MELRTLALVCAAAICAAPTFGQPTQPFVAEWVGQEGPGHLRNPITAGNAADGRPVYICRAQVAGTAKLIGWTGAGVRGCVIAVSKGQYEVKTFDVLSGPITKAGAGKQPGAGQPATPQQLRGIDANGDPFVETTEADGTKHRRTRRGVVTTRPDGTRGPGTALSDAPMPTPPLLPADPASGRAWFESHNNDLLNLISRSVNNDADQLSNYAKRETQETQGDVLKQIYLRTVVLGILVGAR